MLFTGGKFLDEHQDADDLHLNKYFSQNLTWEGCSAYIAHRVLPLPHPLRGIPNGRLQVLCTSYLSSDCAPPDSFRLLHENA